MVRHPDISTSLASDARRKLDYLVVSDYRTVIANRANWRYFESTFRQKNEFMKYLDEFSRYRNALMDNRPLTELARMSGETAILWFNAVFGSAEEPEWDEGSDS